MVSQIQFKLYAWKQWSVVQTKVLNKLEIKIGDEKYMIQIPLEEGETTRTTLSNGTVVTVTHDGSKTRNAPDNTRNPNVTRASVTAPEYTVTMTAPDGREIKGPIDVDTNYKDTDASEVFAVELEGVKPISYIGYRALTDSNGRRSNYHWRAITSDRTADDQTHSYLSTSKVSYFPRSYWSDVNHNSYYFLTYDEGFSDDDLEDLYLEVRNYNANSERQADYITKASFKDLLESGVLVNTKALENEQGVKSLVGTNTIYQVAADSNANLSPILNSNYYFVIGTDTNSQKLLDVRIFVTYEPAEYHVVYDVNGGEWENEEDEPEDVTYSFGDTFIVSEKTPVREGYTFSKWELVKEEKQYNAGTVVQISKDNQQYADLTTTDAGRKKYTYTYKAIWVTEKVSTPYSIKFQFEGLDGQAYDIPALTEYGEPGENVHLLQDRFEEWITEKLPTVITDQDFLNDPAYDPEWWKEYYEIDFDSTDTDIDRQYNTTSFVEADGNTVFNVYYKLKTKELAISKLVPEGMGDTNESFVFQLLIENVGLKDLAPYEMQNIVIKKTDQDDNESALEPSASGSETNRTYEFSLKSGEFVTLSIPVGYSYAISESYAKDYDTFYTINRGEEVEGCEASGTLKPTDAASKEEVQFINRLMRYVKVFKYETGTNPEKALEGAVFTLTHPDGTENEGLITNSDGYLVFEDGKTYVNLASDGKTYTLTETKAPDGYCKIAENVTFTSSKEGVFAAGSGYSIESATETIDGKVVTVYTIKVQNSAGATLPNTGGPGTRLFTILGSILVFGAGALLWRRRRFI